MTINDYGIPPTLRCFGFANRSLQHDKYNRLREIPDIRLFSRLLDCFGEVKEPRNDVPGVGHGMTGEGEASGRTGNDRLRGIRDLRLPSRPLDCFGEVKEPRNDVHGVRHGMTGRGEASSMTDRLYFRRLI